MSNTHAAEPPVPAARVASVPLLGVLGGMGPLATVDFLGKLIGLTRARRDQEHIPTIVSSDPRLPDRSEAILNRREQTVQSELQARVDRLLAAGATAIAVPCNTAHHWMDRLDVPRHVRVLHIADAAIELLQQSVAAGGNVAILATPATLAVGMYQQRLSAAGYDALVPPPNIVNGSVLPAIHAAKAGDVRAARDHLTATRQWMAHAHTDACLLACTELPLARDWSGNMRPMAIDTTLALAHACLRWWQGQTNGEAMAAAAPAPLQP